MLSEANLRNKIVALVKGGMSLDVFEDWFTVASWNAHKGSSPAAVELVGAVELRLDEYSSGHLSFDELSHELEILVRAEPVPVFSLVNSNFVVPINAFEDSFTVASWNTHKGSSPLAVEFVGAVELRLDEYFSGHLSFDEASHEPEALVRAKSVPESSSVNSNSAVSLELSITASSHRQPGARWSSSVVPA